MTEFMGLSKNLIRDKWKTMNWIVVIELIAFVVIYLLRIITGGFNGDMMPSYFIGLFAFETVVVSFVGMIMLARSNERVFTSNNYRLIPVSDTKLYFSNILTTFLAYIYLQIIEAILGNIVMFISGVRANDLMGIGQIASEDYMTMFEIIIFLILGIILTWTGITVIHFLINWISGFLPFARQGIITFVLYIVVTFIALTVFNLTTGKVISFIYQNISPQGIMNFNQLNGVIWLSLGISLVWIIIFTALNIYLLKRWTETIR